MITFVLWGELLAEPRPGQLRREGIREMAARDVESYTDPHMLAYAQRTLEEYSDPATRVVTSSNGERFTRLELQVEDQRVEVSVTGKLAERAAKLEPGDHVRIVGDVLGDNPHHHLRARRITLQPPTTEEQ